MIKRALATRKRRIIALCTLLFVLMAGIASAYFVLVSQGTGHVTDAPVPPFSVILAPPTGGPLSPGVNVDTVTFTIKNTTDSTQTLQSESWSLSTDDNGGVYDTITGVYVDGCQASWFTIDGGDGGVTLPSSMPAGTSFTGGAVTVSMPINTAVDQSGCEGLSPQVEVTAS